MCCEKRQPAQARLIQRPCREDSRVSPEPEDQPHWKTQTRTRAYLLGCCCIRHQSGFYRTYMCTIRHPRLHENKCSLLSYAKCLHGVGVGMHTGQRGAVKKAFGESRGQHLWWQSTFYKKLHSSVQTDSINYFTSQMERTQTPLLLFTRAVEQHSNRKRVHFPLLTPNDMGLFFF